MTAEDRQRTDGGHAPSLSELSPDPMVLLDGDDVIRDANRAWRQTFSPTSERLPRSLLDLVADSDRGPLRAALHRVRSTGIPSGLVTETTTASGTALTIRWRLGSASPEGEVVAIGLVSRAPVPHDLPEEAAAILETVSDAVYRFDRSWRFTYVNRAAERLAGRHRDELLGRRGTDVFPESRNLGLAEAYAEVADTGEPTELELFYPEPYERWFRVRVHPDPDGVSCYFHDISHEKRTEEHLRRSQRLESVASLAAGVAHDFNNLLTAISGHVDLLGATMGEDQRGRGDVEAIRDATNRASQLTGQLLAFSRQQVLRPEPVDVNAAIAALRPLAERLVGVRSHLEIRAGERVPPVRVDPTQLDQVLVNLITNARDAIAEQGSIRITTDAVHLGEGSAAARGSLAPGSYVQISVADDGAGMTPDIVGRAIDPFFTTKDTGEGTGLGLSVSYGIVRQSGGDLTLESEPGRGTVARVLLPTAVDVTPTDLDDATTRTAHRNPGGSELLLVVDDDAQVRSVTARTLRRFGYEVIEGDSAEDALAHLTTPEALAAIDLLLTDVVMPGQTGPELAEELRGRRPDLPVLFMSGYTRTDVTTSLSRGAAPRLLHKPFTSRDLAEVIRETLDRVEPPQENATS